jgi:hypothetical protein
VFSPLKNSAKRRPLKLARRLLGATEDTRRDNTRLASFLSKNNPGPGYTDSYDAGIRRKKRLKTIGLAALTSLATWVVIESAMALSLF